MGLRSLLSGLSLLRDPELVRDFGERRFHLARIAEIQRAFPDAKVHRNILLVGFKRELLALGESATVNEGAVLAFGDGHNGYGHIRVGARTWIGQYNNLRAGGGDITIGADCLISQFCTLVASSHGLEKSALIREQSPDSGTGIVVGDDVWLGAGASLLPGVRIGTGVVVGAGSVVTRDIPDYEIWAGSPARKIGRRE